MLDALHEDALLARKAAEEDDAAQAASRRTPKLKKSTGDPWARHRRGAGHRARHVPAVHVLENGAGFQGRLVDLRAHAGARRRRARQAERRSASANSPTARCRASSSSSAPRVPVYPELEELRLGNSLERMREWLGPDHPVVRKLLSKESPAALAKRLVTETQAGRSGGAPGAVEGRPAAIAASNDPMIELARSVDAEARAVRKAYEDGVEAPHALRHRAHRPRALRRAGHQRVSRRHVHAAPQLRHGAGLERERQAGRAVHAAVARLRARHGLRSVPHSRTAGSA